MNTAVAVDLDAERLAVAVAAAIARQGDELDGRRRSRAAIRRWKERVPMDLRDRDRDVELLVERHRREWLLGAASAVRSLDPNGLGSRPLHVVDLAETGCSSPGVTGLALPGAFSLFRPWLPRSAEPGPVVAVDVGRMVRHHGLRLLDAAPDDVPASVAAAVAGVAIHEAAHVLDRGDLAAVPVVATVGLLRRALAAPRDRSVVAAVHGPRWLRAFAVLTIRASRRPPQAWWREAFAHDVAPYAAAPGAEILDAVRHELRHAYHDEPVAEIIARPPSDRLVALVGAPSCRRP